MPIPLPTSLRKTLVSHIAQGLTESTVIHGAFVSLSPRMWRLHELVASGSKIDKALNAVLGDQHVSDFVTNEVSMLNAGEWDTNSATELFESKLGKDAPSAWAETLVTALESLPWRYTAYSPLPGVIPAGLMESAELPLTQASRLVAGASLEASRPAHKNALWGGRSRSGFEWAPGTIYTQTDFEGYVPRTGESESARDLMRSILSAYGIALALGLLVDDPWRAAEESAPFYALCIFKEDGGPDAHVTNVDFDHAHLMKFKRLGNFSVFNSQTQSPDLHRRVGEIGKVLSKGGPRLLNAARWYFDSHCGSSDQVRFVQICTALEVLLGDESQGREVGLASLMANRCAYFLGKNDKQRTQINEDFRAAYAIRSKIVHAGKSKLSTDDKAHLLYMQSLCTAIIRKECTEIE